MGLRRPSSDGRPSAAVRIRRRSSPNERRNSTGGRWSRASRSCAPRRPRRWAKRWVMPPAARKQTALAERPGARPGVAAARRSMRRAEQHDAHRDEPEHGRAGAGPPRGRDGSAARCAGRRNTATSQRDGHGEQGEARCRPRHPGQRRAQRKRDGEQLAREQPRGPQALPLGLLGDVDGCRRGCLRPPGTAASQRVAQVADRADDEQVRRPARRAGSRRTRPGRGPRPAGTAPRQPRARPAGRPGRAPGRGPLPAAYRSRRRRWLPPASRNR